MVNILYEPESIREDYGILVITAGEPCKVPFSFDITTTDIAGNTQNVIINEDDIVEYTIKQNIKLVTSTIKKRYTGIKNNVSVLALTEADMQLLEGGKDYVMSAKLYDKNNNLLKVLIKILPIRVSEVV